MTVEYVDGIKIMKLRDCHGAGGQGNDAAALLRLWQLLSGGHSARDATVFCHRMM